MFLCLPKILSKLCSCVHYILNFVRENVKKCTCTLISHFSSEFPSFYFVPRPLPRSPFRKFLPDASPVNSLYYKKTGLAYVMEVFQMFDFGQWFRPGPRWGANRAPPEPIARFTGAIFLTEYTSLSLTKITPFSNSGKPTTLLPPQPKYSLPKNMQ